MCPTHLPVQYQLFDDADIMLKAAVSTERRFIRYYRIDCDDDAVNMTLFMEEDSDQVDDVLQSVVDRIAHYIACGIIKHFSMQVLYDDIDMERHVHIEYNRLEKAVQIETEKANGENVIVRHRCR